MDILESIYRYIGWWVIHIDLYLVLVLSVGGGLLFTPWKKWGKGFVLVACLGFFFLGVVPIGLWMVENLENRFPKVHQIPFDTKGVIFLGGTFDILSTKGRKEVSYNLAAGRFIRLLELLRTHPDLEYAFVGNTIEVENTKKELEALGYGYHRIHFNSESTDTRGNAFFAAQLLNPQPDEKWLLMTSAYHMPRSVGLFRKVGFNVIPYPVDYHTPGQFEPFLFLGLKINLDGWYAASREWLGMFANYFMGRSEEIFPGPLHLGTK